MRRAFTLTLLMLMMAMTPMMTGSAQGTGDSVIINEILISPNNENYDGTDWNGDGSMGTHNDQFLELYNPTPDAIDLGGWWLDDIADGGSPACSIGWGTVLEAGAYIAFYRSWTGIEFDFWDGDTIRILDSSGVEVDSVSYGAEDSDWDVPYGYDSGGNWVKLSDGSPTPGGANGQEWGGANHLQGNCYPPQDHIHRGEYVLEGRVVTMESEESVIEDGRILVVDGMIEAVWSASDESPAAAQGVMSIPTSGTIYPGFIDPHNHAKYNIIPLWDHGTDGWDNRYQWQAEDSYQDAKDVGCSLSDSSVMRFAELRAVAGGNTALQGSSTSHRDTFETMLARNIEFYNFGKDYIHTKVTELESDYSGQHIKDGNASGELDAWFLHLAEGVDESSRAEFDILVENDLLVGEVVIIHGTALTQNELSALGDVGGSLAWSPTSNLLLYGDTTDIATAKAEGVNIMIGPDWAPSGSKSSMHELKIVDWWDENVLGDIFTDYELVQTITTNIVDAIGWSEHTGRIQPGLAADFVILDTFKSDPYRNVVEAIDPDVRLVVVGGLAVFGDVDIMQAMDDEIQIIQGEGFTKATDITYDGVPEAQQTVDEMLASLQSCNQGAQVPLEYLFTLGDERYFDVLNSSLTFQNGRTIDLWGDYYDVELNEDGHRVNGTVAGAGPIDISPPINGGSEDTESACSDGVDNDGDPYVDCDDYDCSETTVCGGEGNQVEVPEPELPIIWPTYGPIGATSSTQTTIEEGIHLEICTSDNGQTTPEGKELLCGSILVVMQPTDDCIGLEGGWYCQLEVEDAFAVPGKLCQDVGTMPEDVTCRDAWSYLDIEEESEPETEPELPDTEQESLLDGPLYWVAVISLIGLLIASVVTINQNLRGSDEDE
ncbi:MAG: amidohydrolase family protein [Candidatus Thermoplasmatota archaeon]|nr:amidohydrolase family protein [Candidatus Thermoplasmatota archaeon]